MNTSRIIEAIETSDLFDLLAKQGYDINKDDRAFLAKEVAYIISAAKNSTAINRLAPELRRAAEEMIRNPCYSYTDIVEFLARHGAHVSISAVVRHATIMEIKSRSQQM